MPIKTDRLIDIILSNKEKKMKAVKVIESVPNNLTVIPKLIKSSNTSNINNTDDIKVNKSIFDSVYQNATKIKQNNEHITQLFPDIELSIQILVSSILSPKNMVDIGLNYKFKKELDLPPSISSELLDIIKTDLNTVYELEDNLSDIVREALFESGAYVTAIIPEASVDEVINSDLLGSYSNESLKLQIDTVLGQLTNTLNIISHAPEPMAAVGKAQTFIHKIASEDNLKITDNYNIFKFAKFKDKLRKTILRKSIRNKESISTESIDVINYTDLFRQRGTLITNKQVEIIKNKKETKRSSLGRPLVVKINTESVIPVFSPNNPKDHIGYFILLDENGYPLTPDTDGALTSNNLFSADINQNQLSITEKAHKNLINNASNIDVKTLFDSYKDLIEKKLYGTIHNSLYGSDIKIGNRNDIYFLMFTRALSEQKTTMIFMPEELISYITFYNTKHGTGKSLLDNLSILSSLRAIILFAKIMSYSKMSIDITKVNVSLDPDDPDPEKTTEMVQDSVLKMRQNYFPLGINNPVDLIDWIHRAGLQFSYDSVPGIPNVKIDFENSNLEHTMPADDLEDNLRKLTIMSLGLSPEVVDSGFNPEFATTVVNNNILLSKRVILYQKKLTKHLKKLVCMAITNDEELRFKLRDFIEQNIDQLSLTENEKSLYNIDKTRFFDKYIDTLVEAIELELPKPENTNITNLSAEYDLYKDNLDKVLESVISSEVITSDLSGDLSSHIDSIKTTYKHYLLRKWMSDNNFFPEIFDVVRTPDTENNTITDNLEEELKSIMSNVLNIFTGMQKFKTAADDSLTSATTPTE